MYPGFASPSISLRDMMQRAVFYPVGTPAPISDPPTTGNQG